MSSVTRLTAVQLAFWLGVIIVCLGAGGWLLTTGIALLVADPFSLNVPLVFGFVLIVFGILTAIAFGRQQRQFPKK